MDAQDFRSLQEAYMEVVENQQLDEVSDKRVAAVGRKREKNVDKAMNKYLDDKISSHDLATTVGKASRFRVLSDRRARRKTNEQVDIYDIILSHLLDEGYAETPEAAEAIMVNMSEEWRQSIIG
jgi:hypothetical protein